MDAYFLSSSIEALDHLTLHFFLRLLSCICHLANMLGNYTRCCGNTKE